MVQCIPYCIYTTGEWSPHRIPNPDTSFDGNPLLHLDPIVGIAVEVWTTVGGIHLDNIIIARSLRDAFKFAEQTFLIKSKAETAHEVEAARSQKQLLKERKLAEGNIKAYAEVYLNEISEYILESPIKIGFMVAGTLLFIAIATFFMFGNAASVRVEDDHSTRDILPDEDVEREEEKHGDSDADSESEVKVEARSRSLKNKKDK